MPEIKSKDGRTEEELKRLEEARISMEAKIAKYHQNERARVVEETKGSETYTPNNDVVSILKEKPYLLDSKMLFGYTIKEQYSDAMFNAMMAIYSDGILSAILSKQYINNDMMGSFVYQLIGAGFSKEMAVTAMLEWVYICSEIFGLTNKLDMHAPLNISNDYRISLGFQPYLKIGYIYDYNKYLNMCKSGNADQNCIGLVLEILFDYLFHDVERADIEEENIGLNKIQTLDVIEEVLGMIEEERSLYPYKLIWLAQVYMLKREYDAAIESYETLLQIKEISEPEDLDENYYCGELETASMIAHNIMCAYILAGMPRKALIAQLRYERAFRLQIQFYEEMKSRNVGDDEDSIRRRNYIDREKDDLLNTNTIAFYDFSFEDYYFGKKKSKMESIISECSKGNKSSIEFVFEKIGFSISESGALIVSNNEYSEETPLFKLPVISTVLTNDTDDIEHKVLENDKAIETPLEHSYDQLDSLIGLDAIKSDVHTLINLMKMQVRRKEQGLKEVPLSLHLVFSGNPGTGKTTIARILADIYKEIGVLSKGQLVEVDRSDLVAGYVGQTAIKTQEKIDSALGGILFIDEAYTLIKDGEDYGQEAVDTILKAMEDHREDFIVIVAGYSDLMRGFINSNPGLKSRFNKYIEFPDYTVDELIQIFLLMCRKYEFELEEDAKIVMKNKITVMEMNKDENFANARDVRNMFEDVISRQANRLASDPTADMTTIIAADFG